MGLEPQRVEPGRSAAAARTLSRAFADDPVVNYFVRTGPRRAPARDRWFDLAVRQFGLPAGETWSLDEQAVSLWLPPPQAALNMSVTAQLRIAPAVLSVVGLDRVSRFMRLGAAFDRHHPKDRHWYLFFLAVDPASQGKGLGGALLRHKLAALDEAGECAYLEASSQRNVPLYQRHGFEIISEFRPEPDGPTLWGMWRKAR